MVYTTSYTVHSIGWEMDGFVYSVQYFAECFCCQHCAWTLRPTWEAGHQLAQIQVVAPNTG